MSVWPAWQVQEAGGVTTWFHVRLEFTDGARVESLAVVCEEGVSVEDVRAQPPLSLVDLTVLADWIKGPLFERCAGVGLGAQDVEGAEDAHGVVDTRGVEDAQRAEDVGVPDGADDVRAVAATGYPGESPAPRRARPAWPRGLEGRWLVAQEYRAAQEEGADPVLAVMCATGHSRRKSLRLIAQARDVGYLTPRHARR
ncbi:MULTISPECIES: DUF6214 family protein [unclassified Streptomyces]|uniref:DUF6214 family protein n=1 Tax=unclassified Streptomyces TaxID=2593676 RepID=UPI0037FAEE24